jgi:hypothetical protein
MSYLDEERILLIENIVLLYTLVSLLEERVACMFRLEEYYSSLNVDIAVFLTTRHISRDCSLLKGKHVQVKPVSGQWLVKGTGTTNHLNLHMLLLSRLVQLHN